MENYPDIDNMILDAKYLYQIEYEYGVCVKTLKRWLIRENINIPKGLIPPYHQKTIYKTFGIPRYLRVA
jgi:hypothetical protein